MGSRHLTTKSRASPGAAKKPLGLLRARALLAVQSACCLWCHCFRQLFEQYDKKKEENRPQSATHADKATD